MTQRAVPAEAHLSKEEQQFLTGSPPEVRQVALEHAGHFRSAGQERIDETQLRLHASLGEAAAAQQDAHAPAVGNVGGKAEQAESSRPSGTSTQEDEFLELAHRLPGGNRAGGQEEQQGGTPVEVGTEYRLGQAAESMDFAVEEADAS